MRKRFTPLALALAFILVSAACGSDTTDSSADDEAPMTDQPAALDGVSVVSPDEAAVILAHPPDDLVVLDVRTAEEFAEGHLSEATMLDFYAPDFADRLAGLDRNVPYLVYCRSGNRSGQTRALMDDLGFTQVADVDGGIAAWTDAGLPVDR